MSKVTVYAAQDDEMLELVKKKPMHFFLKNEGRERTMQGPLCGFAGLSENICVYAFRNWAAKSVWPRVSCKNCLRLKRFYEENLVAR